MERERAVAGCDGEGIGKADYSHFLSVCLFVFLSLSLSLFLDVFDCVHMCLCDSFMHAFLCVFKAMFVFVFYYAPSSSLSTTLPLPFLCNYCYAVIEVQRREK